MDQQLKEQARVLFARLCSEDCQVLAKHRRFLFESGESKLRDVFVQSVKQELLAEESAPRGVLVALRRINVDLVFDALNDLIHCLLRDEFEVAYSQLLRIGQTHLIEKVDPTDLCMVQKHLFLSIQTLFRDAFSDELSSALQNILDFVQFVTVVPIRSALMQHSEQPDSTDIQAVRFSWMNWVWNAANRQHSLEIATQIFCSNKSDISLIFHDREHVEVFLNGVDLLIRLLTNPQSLRLRFSTLTKKHLDMGVKVSMINDLSQLFIQILELVIWSGWNDELARSWRSVWFHFISLFKSNLILHTLEAGTRNPEKARCRLRLSQLRGLSVAQGSFAARVECSLSHCSAFKPSFSTTLRLTDSPCNGQTLSFSHSWDLRDFPFSEQWLSVDLRLSHGLGFDPEYCSADWKGCLFGSSIWEAKDTRFALTRDVRRSAVIDPGINSILRVTRLLVPRLEYIRSKLISPILLITMLSFLALILLEQSVGGKHNFDEQFNVQLRSQLSAALLLCAVLEAFLLCQKKEFGEYLTHWSFGFLARSVVMSRMVILSNTVLPLYLNAFISPVFSMVSQSHHAGKDKRKALETSILISLFTSLVLFFTLFAQNNELQSKFKTRLSL